MTSATDRRFFLTGINDSRQVCGKDQTPRPNRGQRIIEENGTCFVEKEVKISPQCKVRLDSIGSSDLDLTPSVETPSPSWNALKFPPRLCESVDGIWNEEIRRQRMDSVGSSHAVSQMDGICLNGKSSEIGANFSKGRNGGERGRKRRGRGSGGENGTGSDTDSGNGTIFSDCLESPTQEVSFTVLPSTPTQEFAGFGKSLTASPEHLYKTDNISMASTNRDVKHKEHDTAYSNMYITRHDSRTVDQDDTAQLHYMPRFTSQGFPSGNSEEEAFEDPRYQAEVKFESERVSGQNQWVSSYDHCLPVISGETETPTSCRQVHHNETRCGSMPDIGLAFCDISGRIGEDGVRFNEHKLRSKCRKMFGSHSKLHDNSHDTRSHFRGRVSSRDSQGSSDDVMVSHDDFQGRRQCDNRECCYSFQDIGQGYNNIQRSHHDVQDDPHDIFVITSNNDSLHDLHSSHHDISVSTRDVKGMTGNNDSRHHVMYASHRDVYDDYDREGQNALNGRSKKDRSCSLDDFEDQPNSLPTTPSGQGRLYASYDVIPSSHKKGTPTKATRYIKRTMETSFDRSTGSDNCLYGQECSKWSPSSTTVKERVTRSEYKGLRAEVSSPTGKDVRKMTGGVDQGLSVSRTEPALDQPFSDEVVTLPRRGKSGSSPEEASPSGECGKIYEQKRSKSHRPSRRWTNLGLCGSTIEMNSSSAGNKATSSRNSGRGGESTVPHLHSTGLFRSRKNSPSTAFVGTGPGSHGDISMQSLSFSSTQSVFEASRSSTGSVCSSSSAMDNGFFQRSISSPDSSRRSQSSNSSLLEKIRARLTPWKTSPSKPRPPVGLVANGVGGCKQTNSCSTQDEKETVITRNFDLSSEEGVSRTTSFQTFVTPDTTAMKKTKVVELSDQKVRPHSFSHVYVNATTSAASSPSSAPISEAATGAYRWPAPGEHSRRGRKQSCHFNDRMPSHKDVIETILEVDEQFANFKETSVGSCLFSDSDDRTITKDEFNCRKQAMVDELKTFIDNCRRMVINTPSTESGFLQELAKCRNSLGGIRYRCLELVECTSLPVDRSRVAVKVEIVASSFKETVLAASKMAGLTVRHSGMGQLRVKADRLVKDLSILMKAVRDINYNNLSRRF